MNTSKLIRTLAIALVLLFGQQSAIADNRSHGRDDWHNDKHRPSHEISKHSDHRRHDQRYDRRRYDGPEPHYKPYYQPGYHVKPLPRGYSRVFVNSLEYFFFDGFFYWPYRDSYVIVDAPIGAIITQLPHFSRLLHWRGQPYYVVGNTYYRPHHRGYVVVPDPGFGYRR